MDDRSGEGLGRGAWGGRRVWIAAVVATHPLVVWARTEIRVYALILLLSTLLTLAFFDAYWVPGKRGRARLVFAALALLGVYTQYYMAALLACFGVVLLLRRDWQSVGRYAADMGVVGVLAIPLLVAVRMQFGSHHEDFGPSSSLGGGTLRLVAMRFESYVFSFNKAIDEARWSPGTIRLARWAYRAAVLAAIGIPLWSLRRRVIFHTLARRWPLFVIVASYALCMFLLLRMTGPLTVGDRHIVPRRGRCDVAEVAGRPQIRAKIEDVNIIDFNLDDANR